MVLQLFSIVIALLATYKIAKRLSHTKSSQLKKRDKPLSVLILNMYGLIPDALIKSLSNKYSIHLRAEQYSTKEQYGTKEQYKEKRKEFIKKIDPEKEEIEYKKILEFIDKHPEIFPDIVILCSDRSVFYTSTPYLLYSAETLHYREEFTQNTLIKALDHYRRSEIRNGK